MRHTQIPACFTYQTVCDALYIMEYYNEASKKPSLNALQPRVTVAIGYNVKEYFEQLHSRLPSKSKCRIEVEEEAKVMLKVIVRNALIARSANPGRDISWSHLLECIFKSGKRAEWWDDLPTFVTQLIRSDSQYGAGPAFLAIYSSLYKDKISFYNSLCVNFQSSARGDGQCWYNTSSK